MKIITAVLYGIVQGLTEFLPVSSSGHLSLMQNFFGAENLESTYLSFTVLLHLGTLAAVFIAYYKDVWMLIKGFCTLVVKLFTGKIKQGLDSGERLFLLLLIATIPLIPAALLSDKVEALTKISWLIGVFLILNGFLLYLSDKLSNPKYTIGTMMPKHALLVGIVQLFGVMPGISRSGSTITGGLFAGLERKEAVKFSFLLSIPAILGANILEIPNMIGDPSFEGNALPFLCGVIAAALAGLAAIKLLQYIAKAKKLSVFSLYCVIVGAAAIIYDIVR